ncbi:unnamed protein product, partial [marine sediment metagenome]
TKSLYHILNTYFHDQGYYMSRNRIRKDKYQEFKEKVSNIFENHLNNEDMEEIYNYFDLKTKTNKDASENASFFQDKIRIDEDEEFSNCFGYNFYDKKDHRKLNEAKEKTYSELLEETINISEIERNLKNLGDGFEFKQFISLVAEINELYYFHESDKKKYEKIQPENRKKLQKYLFSWILEQRQRFESNLSHDSISVADESNEICDADQGISIDNLFKEVFINGIDHGYFSAALNYLKENSNNDWYNIIKNYTLFQLEPGITQISSVQNGYRSWLNIPINQIVGC